MFLLNYKNLFFSGLFLCFLCVACQEKIKDKSVEAYTGENIQVNEMGKNVYNINCATCHGSNGEGDGPAAVGFKPRNFKKDKFKNGATIDGIKKTLAEGIPGTQMIAWKGVLSKKQVNAVSEYVVWLVSKKN